MTEVEGGEWAMAVNHKSVQGKLEHCESDARGRHRTPKATAKKYSSKMSYPKLRTYHLVED